MNHPDDKSETELHKSARNLTATSYSGRFARLTVGFFPISGNWDIIGAPENVLTSECVNIYIYICSSSLTSKCGKHIVTFPLSSSTFSNLKSNLSLPKVIQMAHST